MKENASIEIKMAQETVQERRNALLFPLELSYSSMLVKHLQDSKVRELERSISAVNKTRLTKYTEKTLVVPGILSQKSRKGE